MNRFAPRLAVILFCGLLIGCAAKTPRIALNAAADPPQETPIDPPGASAIVPPLEIVASELLVNFAGRMFMNSDHAFDVTRDSIRRNLGSAWVVDDDPFQINQAGHPYQGAIYHAIARSAGRGFWTSAAYTFAGSALWEIAGETTTPSTNDQIASGIAGVFLGESLFRTANLLIDKAGGRPGPGRMLLVLFVSPPTAVNRTLFGDTFDGVLPTHDPLYDVRLQVGSIGALRRFPSSVLLRRDESMVDMSIEYGLPGRTGYRYSRPFDYYELRATASSLNGLEHLMANGLIAGHDYSSSAIRGLWGLYGTYDYIAPQVFRVSTTALAIGTNAQVRAGEHVALKLGGSAGVGYSAAQALADENDRAYHYGVTPHVAVSLGVQLGSRIALDAAARGFFISNVGGFALNPRIDDVVARGEASLGVRIYRRGALSVRYLISQRDTTHPETGHASARRETIGLFFTLLGPQRFGAVDWRK